MILPDLWPIICLTTAFEQMKSVLRTGDGARLLDPANHEWSPATDFDLCLDLDRFDFVLRLAEEKGTKCLECLT